MRGTLQLTVDRNPQYRDNCVGFDEEGFGDIYVGQRVVVLDGNQNTLGIGQLTGCKFSPLESREQARGLLFTFRVADVPEADFYSVQIGSGQRGAVPFSKADLVASGWRPALSL